MKENKNENLTPDEVKIILLALTMMLEDHAKAVDLPEGKQWTAKARKDMQEMADTARSAKKKLEVATMGGAKMHPQEYKPGDEKEFMENVEREVIDIPNDQGQPKLKRLIEEITEILVAEDVAGMVALHTPGAAEHMLFMQPSYSCVKEVDGETRFVATEKEHGKEGRSRLIASTSNMLHLLAEACARPTMIVMEMEKQLEDGLIDKGYKPTKHYQATEKPAGEKHPDPLDNDEYQFKAVSRVTFKANPDKKSSDLLRTDYYMEVFGRIDPDVYLQAGGRLPTQQGAKPFTIALLYGLIGNIHMSHQKGWWDSAEHMRYIMDILEHGFVQVLYPTEGAF